MKNITKAIRTQSLLATWKANNNSTNARNSETTILKFLPIQFRQNKNLQKEISKTFKFLVANAYLIKHPSGEMTYQVSTKGRDYISTL